jgi:hypothetical protein
MRAFAHIVVKETPGALSRAAPGQELYAMVPISNSSTSRKPECAVISFPPRGRFRFAVRVERERGDCGWLVLTHDRAFGWLHGSFDSAQQDAAVIAAGYGVAVVSSAGRLVP